MDADRILLLEEEARSRGLIESRDALDRPMWLSPTGYPVLRLSNWKNGIVFWYFWGQPVNHKGWWVQCFDGYGMGWPYLTQWRAYHGCRHSIGRCGLLQQEA